MEDVPKVFEDEHKALHAFLVSELLGEFDPKSPRYVITSFIDRRSDLITTHDAVAHWYQAQNRNDDDSDD
jgi:hypothetical protein